MRLLILVFLPFFCFAGHLSTVYHSLDPTSIRQQLAFYSLYPNTSEGNRAKARALILLSKHAPKEMHIEKPFTLPNVSVEHLLSLTHLFPEESQGAMSNEDLAVIDALCSFFPNRSLPGHYATDEKQLDNYSSDEIDLARSILLIEYKNDPDKMQKIAQYEASLDFMALEVLAKLPKNCSPLEKVHVINDYIFHELQFRFPPHSLWAKDIDEYTLLPSVMDSRLGVCLGVSILYLSLSQRIGLPLEIVTPPGHIYVRLRSGEKVTVIETTARGISLPEDTYLSVNTKSLKQRTMKEVVGLAFFNQASVSWRKGKYEKARDNYAIAKRFVPDDPLIDELYGFTHLLTNNRKEGEALLRRAQAHPSEDEIFHNSVIEEYFSGNLNLEGLKILFQEVDHKRESIEKKRDQLRALVKTFPRSKELTFHLAITYLQLGRGKEAYELLKRYTQFEKGNPNVYYFLSILSIERYNYIAAWEYILLCEELCKKHTHTPKTITVLKSELQRKLPKPKKRYL